MAKEKGYDQTIKRVIRYLEEDIEQQRVAMDHAMASMRAANTLIVELTTLHANNTQPSAVRGSHAQT